MQQPVTSRAAYFALFAGVAAIGFAPLFVRLAGVGPSAVGFYRVLLALPVLWLLLAREAQVPEKSPQPRSPKSFLYLAAAGLLFFSDLAIWHWSLQFTSVANSTLLTNLAPVFVTLGAWVLFREKITSRFLLGLCLALGGGTVMVMTTAEFRMSQVWGDMLASVAAIFYAAYVLLMKHIRRLFTPVTIMAWSSLVSCPLFLIAALLAGEEFKPPDANAWGALIGLALITHVGGQTLISYALGRLPASLTSAALFLQPVIAAALAWSILSEPLTWLQTLGGFTALAGILIATRPGRR